MGLPVQLFNSEVKQSEERQKWEWGPNGSVSVYFTENDVRPFDKVPRERKGRLRDMNYPYFYHRCTLLQTHLALVESDESVKFLAPSTIHHR